jgi:hypothetical protein
VSCYMRSRPGPFLCFQKARNGTRALAANSSPVTSTFIGDIIPHIDEFGENSGQLSRVLNLPSRVRLATVETGAPRGPDGAAGVRPF